MSAADTGVCFLSEPKLKIVEGSGGRDPRAMSQLDWAALACVALALFLAPLVAGVFALPPLNIMPFTLGIPLVIGLTAVAAGLVVVREWGRPVAVGAVPGLAGALLLLGVWAGLSVVRVPALIYGLNTLAALLAGLLLGGIVSRLARDRNALIVLLLTLTAGASVVAALTIREYVPMARIVGPGYRAFGGFLTPDFLAGYLLLTLPITLAAASATDEPILRLLLGLATGLQAAALMLTGSRAGALAFFAALAAWGVLAFWSGAARGRGKSIGIICGVLLLGALAGSGPMRARITGAGNGATLANVQAAADSQAHSGAFRKQTWIGTVRMATANPVIGTGIGSYETAYPRYAVVAFTAHAHNSYLQWLAETGIPGALFLLTALAAVFAFALNVLRLGIVRPGANDTLLPDTRAALLYFSAPRLILTGMLAALTAAMIKSFIDSDWYIVANLFTLSGVLALTVGLSRDLAPLATQMPRPLSKGMLAFGGLLALVLLIRTTQTGYARMLLASVHPDTPPQEAVAALQSAHSADPLDPEPLLALVLPDLQQNTPATTQAALQSLDEAVRVAPTGKTFYRRAQFHARAGQLDRAIADYEQAQAREPHNVQNLRALGDALHRSGKPQQAASVYQIITDLENSNYGKIRAVPEMIEPDFVFAHIGLAEIAAEAQNIVQADAEYARAQTILRTFWHDRHNGYYDNVPPEKYDAWARAYADVLGKRSVLLNAIATPPALADRTQVENELSDFTTQKQADDAARNSAGQAGQNP